MPKTATPMNKANKPRENCWTKLTGIKLMKAAGMAVYSRARMVSEKTEMGYREKLSIDSLKTVAICSALPIKNERLWTIVAAEIKISAATIMKTIASNTLYDKPKIAKHIPTPKTKSPMVEAKDFEINTLSQTSLGSAR